MTKYRQDMRRPFVKAVRYSVKVSHIGKSKEIYTDGVLVDISEEGFGMITDYPLREGDFVFFEHDIKSNNIPTSIATVRWATEIEKNRYRVGLKFTLKQETDVLNIP